MSFARRFIKKHKSNAEPDRLTGVEAKILREIRDGCEANQLPPQEAFFPRHVPQLQELRRRGMLDPLDYGEREANGTALTVRGRKALEQYEWDHAPETE